jgi:hypothetical protein
MGSSFLSNVVRSLQRLKPAGFSECAEFFSWTAHADPGAGFACSLRNMVRSSVAGADGRAPSILA